MQVSALKSGHLLGANRRSPDNNAETCRSCVKDSTHELLNVHLLVLRKFFTLHRSLHKCKSWYQCGNRGKFLLQKLNSVQPIATHCAHFTSLLMVRAIDSSDMN